MTMPDSIATPAVMNATDGLTYRFEAHPRYEPVESYEEALAVFLERIETVPGIVSVYESGAGVSVPGISDIDLIVVVEDDIEDPQAVRDGIEEAKTDEYFFFHGPEVLTRETFSEYYNVLPMPKDLYLHYGEQLPHKKNQDEFNYLVYLVDSVNDTYPMEFLEFLFFPGISLSSRQFDILVNDMIDVFVPRVVAEQFPVRIDTRFAIHRLNSLRNDMQLFVDATRRDAPQLDEFDRKITALRSNWFDFDRAEQERQLLDRLRDAITACFTFVGHIDEHLRDCGVSIETGTVERRTMDVFPNEYWPEWSIERAERTTLENYRTRRIKTSVLPQSVTVNDRLRNDGGVSVPDGYAAALQKRDSTKRRRDASMATYKYHPLRSQYMSGLERLHALKTSLVT